MTKDEKRKERDKALQEYYKMQLEQNSGCAAPTWAFMLFLIIVLLSACTKTVYQPVPVYDETHDTIVKKETVEKEVIKEVTVRDSASFRQSGDTVTIERWHWARDYRYEKILEAKIDSLSHVSADTVYKPIPIEIEVAAELTKWQIFLITLGKVFIVIIVLTVLVAIIKKRLLF